MPDVARLQVVIEAQTAAVEAGFARTNALLAQLGTHSAGAGVGFGRLTTSFAAGTLAANALQGALGGIANLMGQAAQSTLSLGSRLEQARIGFTTMLGSVQKADEFIGKLQAKAESTAFSFPGLQQVSQSLMAMGVSAENVIPIIDDMSNALSAAGHGGEVDALQRVGQSLSEIQAQGKISGEQIRELSRNGIAVLPMLADAFGVTGAEIRKMTEAGEISSTRFFEIFHSYVAEHYGDIQAKQAQTWAVAASNVGDIVGRLATQTLSELIDTLTRGALALNNFLHSDQVTAWAANFKQAIHEVLTALEPLTGVLQNATGGTGVAAAATAKPAPAVAVQVRDTAWRIPSEAIKSVSDYKTEIAAATLKVHELTGTINALSARKLTLKFEIEDVKADFGARIQGLRDQQDALNVAIEGTKARYAAILEPLQRVQGQLTRLGEDTKSAFAAILDPLRSQLEGVNRQIADSKAAYEATVRPIQTQIDAIEKANQALARQRSLQNELADLALRQKILNAAGDPTARGDIAAKLQLLQFGRDDLDRQLQLLELGNRKGQNDKAIQGIQDQINSKKAEEIRLEQAAAALIDRSATAEAARQTIINNAAKEQNSILQANADLAAQAAEAPLKDKLAAAQAQLKSVLDPLEAQQAAITRAIQDTSAAETAAMAPIIAAQQQLARQIQDVNDAQKAALAPMEAQQKAITAAIAATEAAQRAALKPLEDQERSLQRQIDLAEGDKKKWEEIGTTATDALKAMEDQAKKAADAATKIPLKLSGGTPDEPGQGPILGPPVPNALIPQGLIDDIHKLAQAATELRGAFIGTDGAATGLTKVLAGLALAFGIFAVVGQIAAIMLGLDAALLGVGGTLATLSPALILLGAILGVPVVVAGALVIAIAGLVVAIGLYATNFEGFRDRVNAGAQNIRDTIITKWGEIPAATEANHIKEMALWNGFLDGVLKANAKAWSDMAAATAANREKETAAWNAFWKGLTDGATTGWNALTGAIALGWLKFQFEWQVYWAERGQDFSKAWDGLTALAQAGWKTFTDWLSPAVDGVVKFFDPLLAVFAKIAAAIATLPGNLKSFVDGLPPWLKERLGGGGSGGGFQTTAYHPGQGGVPGRGDIVGDIPPWRAQGAGDPGWSGGGAAGADPEAISIIVATAIRHNIDPIIALALAKAESGLNPGAVGDSGHSVGLYQLHDQGQGAGMSVAERSDPAINAEKFLSGNAQLFQELKAQGLEREALVSAFGRAAERPAGMNDPNGTAAQNYIAAYRDLAAQYGDTQAQQVRFDLSTVGLNDTLSTSDQVAQATATSQAKLAGIMAQGGQAVQKAVAPTAQLAAAQQDNGVWAATMAQQQAALTAVMQGQAPAGTAAADALKAMSAVVGPIERQVAAGSIGVENLNFKLLDLGRATGLATEPWDRFSAGTLDSQAAMEQLIRASAGAGPQFAAIATYLDTAGSSSTEASLRFLQLLVNYGKLPAVAATVAGATTAVAGANTAVSNALDPLAGDKSALLQQAAEASIALAAALGKTDEALLKVKDSASQASEIIREFFDATKSLGDYLDGHTFKFHIDLPNIPDWAKPGSPTPFEMGLRGIGKALKDVSQISAPALSGISAPTMEAPTFSGGGSGGGGGGQTINWTGNLIIQGADRDPKAIAREIRDELVKMGRHNVTSGVR